MTLKYKIIERTTNRPVEEIYPSCPFIVTPDGQVASWDENQGWEVDQHQDRWNVVMLEYTEPAPLTQEENDWLQFHLGYLSEANRRQIERNLLAGRDTLYRVTPP